MVCRSIALAFIVLGLATSVRAESIDAGDVTVDFDRATFSFMINGLFPIEITPASVDIHGIANGVEIDFGNRMSVSDFATGESDPQEAETGDFNATFSFLPDAGITIAGYRVTLDGTYDIEHPGQASADVTGVGGASFGTSASLNTPFVQSFEVVGAVAPAITGSISAVGLVDFIEVQTGTEIVQVGTTFEPDPGCSDPDPSLCPLIEVPIFEERPVFTLQSDLGGASMNLQRIRLEAIVPEPSSGLFSIAAASLCLSRRWRSAMCRQA